MREGGAADSNGGDVADSTGRCIVTAPCWKAPIDSTPLIEGCSTQPPRGADV
jgi:hypothetical protein